MNFSLLLTLLLAFNLNIDSVDLKDLIGKWQLVYAEGIAKIKASPQYKSADPTMRANIDYKIQSRLENTVYDFMSTDSLSYTDLENGTLVIKKAKIELKGTDVLVITSGTDVREARILEVDANKLVLETISTNSGGGKLEFERILDKKE